METYRITKWMANESARQCGPCAFGLPALAEDLQQLVLGGKDRKQSLDRLIYRAAEIDGRGACKHPDGVVRMVRTALKVFEKDLANHINGAPCVGSRDTKFYATVPKYEREEDLVWE
jgi:NADH:ubiquinone oxidoreductase subunit F (NADH-binding)